MTKPERQLLKALAAAYAFIWNLRLQAVHGADTDLVRLTAGIDKAIAKAEETYGRDFRRYFSAALKKAQAHREEQAQAQAAREAATQGRVARAKKSQTGKTKKPRR